MSTPDPTPPPPTLPTLPQLTQTLHTFYNTPLTPQTRQTLQTTLLTLRQSPQFLKLALTTLSTLSTTTLSTDLDAITVYFLLGSVERGARFGLEEVIGQEVWLGIVKMLCGILVGFIGYCLEKGDGGDGRGEGRRLGCGEVPGWVIGKVERVCCEVGIRGWLKWVGVGGKKVEVVEMGLEMVGKGAVAGVGRVLGGVGLLECLVGVVWPEVGAGGGGFLKRELQVLREGVLLQGGDILEAMELGLRMAGPEIPMSLAAGAAGALGVLTRVGNLGGGEKGDELRVGAAGVLQRCLLGGRYNEVGVEMLRALADIYDKRVSEQEVSRGVDHLVTLIREASSIIGDAGMGIEKLTENYWHALMLYVQVVVPRRLARGMAGLETVANCLNVLMDATIQIAKVNHGSDELVAIASKALTSTLETWIIVIDRLEDAGDKQALAAMEKGLENVGKVSLEKCFFLTNARALRGLEFDDEDVVQDGTDWSVESLTQLSTSEARKYALSKVLVAMDKSIKLKQQDLDLQSSPSIRTEYMQKCTEAIGAIILLHPQGVVARQTFSLVTSVLSQNVDPKKYGDASEAALDLVTAATLSVSLESTETRQSLIASYTSALRQCCESANLDSSHQPRAITTILTAATQMCSPETSSPEFNQIATTLLESQGPTEINKQAALYLRKIKSLQKPSDSYPRHTQYIIVRSLVTWAFEKEDRIQDLLSTAEMAFKQYLSACQTLDVANMQKSNKKFTDLAEYWIMVYTGAQLLPAVFGMDNDTVCKYNGRLWDLLGEKLARASKDALIGAIYASMATSGDEQQVAFGVVAALTEGLSVILRRCRASVGQGGGRTLEEVLGCVVPVAERSGIVALVVLKVIGDEMRRGDASRSIGMIRPALTIAQSALEENEEEELRAKSLDLEEIAVSLVVNVLKTHWLHFWPEYTASAKVPGHPENGAGNGISGASVPREVFFGALKLLIGNVANQSLSVSRATCLGLQRLNASRKMFSRKDAFWISGAAQAVISNATIATVLQGGSAVDEEASEIIYEVAKENWKWFYDGAWKKVVRSLDGMTPQIAETLVSAFGTPTDRTGFLAALNSFDEDLRSRIILAESERL